MALRLPITKRQFLAGLVSVPPAFWLARTAGALGLAPVSIAGGARIPAGSWDSGTVVVEGTAADGRVVKRAYSWSPTGYVLIENGEVLARWGTP